MKFLVIINILVVILAPAVLCSCFGQLYSGDFIRRGLEFDTGKYSYVYKNGLISMSDMDLSFGNIQPGNLTIGVQGQNKAAFANLGTEADLAIQYSIIPVADGNVYSSIIFNSENGTFSILKNQDAYTFQPLFVFVGNVQPMQSFMPIPLNIYIINSTYNNDKTEQYKLLRLFVVSVSANIVSIRWDILYDSDEDLNDINCGRQAINDKDVLTESAIYNYPPLTASVPAWLYAIAVAAIAIAVVAFIGLIILTVARPSPNYQRIQ